MIRRLDSLPVAVAVLAAAAGIATLLLPPTGDQRRKAEPAPSALSPSSESPAGEAPALSAISADTGKNGTTALSDVWKETCPQVPPETLAALFVGSTGHGGQARATEALARIAPTRRSEWRFVAVAVNADGRRVYLFAGAVARRVLALTEGEEIDGWMLERIGEESFILSDGSQRYEVSR